MTLNIKRQVRPGLPQVGYPPYRQIHAHSTANPSSTAQNEADYMNSKNIATGFYQFVVGNGKVIQTGEVNRGSWDVGGGYNFETYAAVELIESHKNREEFMVDYMIFCELLRTLANQGGIPVTLNSSDLAGIKTHEYCTNHQPNNKSDHIDPRPYLSKWGISSAQFEQDIKTANAGTVIPVPDNKQPSIPTDQSFRYQVGTTVEFGGVFTNSDQASKANANNGYVPASRLQKNNGKITRQLRTNGVDTYLIDDGFGWINNGDVSRVLSGNVQPSNPIGSWVPENAKFKCNTSIIARSGQASVRANRVWTFDAGDVITYDAYLIDGGYVWIRQKRGDGSYWYIPTGEYAGRRTSTWGTFI